MKLFPCFTTTLLLVATMPASACYVVYNQKNEMIYDKFEPPVNMTYPLSKTVPMRVPGGHMVFETQSSNCSGVDQLPRHQLQADNAAKKRALHKSKKRRAKRR